MGRRQDRGYVQEFMKKRQEEIEEELELLEESIIHEESEPEENWDP